MPESTANESKTGAVAAPVPAEARAESEISFAVVHSTVRDALRENGYREKKGRWTSPDGRAIDPFLVGQVPETVKLLRDIGFVVMPPLRLATDAVEKVSPCTRVFAEAVKTLVAPPFLTQLRIPDGPGRTRHAYAVGAALAGGHVVHHIVTDPMLPPARTSLAVEKVGGDMYGGAETDRVRDANWLVNKPRVLEYYARRPWERPDFWPQSASGVVYLLASGPSLACALPVLPKIRHGCIVAVNEVADYLDPALIDRYVLHSPFSPPKWWRGRKFKGPCAAYVGCSAPEDAPFPAGVEWYNFAMPSNALLWRESLELVPDLPFLNQAKVVSAMAFSLACRAPGLRMIVLVGCDCSYPGGFEYPGKIDRSPTGFNVRGVDGRPVKTTETFYDAFVSLTSYAAYMTDRGVRVVNASCVGLLGTVEIPSPGGKRSRIEAIPLEEIVARYDKPAGDQHGDTESTEKGGA